VIDPVDMVALVAPKPEPEVPPVPLHKVREMLQHARLKFPAIVIATDIGDLRLTISGSESRYPGSLNVATANHVANKAGDMRREYLGWIAADGQFMPCKALADNTFRVNLIRTGLSEFAADPEGVAGAYGRRTGNCCFCRKPLSDGYSLEVGYGPECAKHYGLL
jgi:Family of unknown function (DUF6011)